MSLHVSVSFRFDSYRIVLYRIRYGDQSKGDCFVNLSILHELCLHSSQVL